ncbi:MAG TPA: hypothetical protein VNY30_10745 [Bryobacteraceae bacterium]|nr:hypothetical protein [Bryobacteraceae bacterium]
MSDIRSREGLLLAEDGGVDLSQPREAAVLFREAYSAVEEDARNEPKDYLSRDHIAECRLYLGNVRRHSSPRQALETYDHGLMRIREVPSDIDIQARRQEAALLAASSYAARWLHREGDARHRIEAAFRLLRETKDYPFETIKLGSEADATLRALADHYAETSEPNQALEAYQDMRGKILKSNPDAQNDLLNAAQRSRLDAILAGLLRRAGRSEGAALWSKIAWSCGGTGTGSCRINRSCSGRLRASSTGTKSDPKKTYGRKRIFRSGDAGRSVGLTDR